MARQGDCRERRYQITPNELQRSEPLKQVVQDQRPRKAGAAQSKNRASSRAGASPGSITVIAARKTVKDKYAGMRFFPKSPRVEQIALGALGTGPPGKAPSTASFSIRRDEQTEYAILDLCEYATTCANTQFSLLTTAYPTPHSFARRKSLSPETSDIGKFRISQKQWSTPDQFPKSPPIRHRNMALNMLNFLIVMLRRRKQLTEINRMIRPSQR